MVGQIGPNVSESPDSDGDAEHDAEERADAFPTLQEADGNDRDESGERDNLDHISLDTPDWKTTSSHTPESVTVADLRAGVCDALPGLVFS